MGNNKAESPQSRTKTRKQEPAVESPANEIKEEQSERQCPECQNTSLITQNGEITCEKCGLVVDDQQIDRGPDWRAFDSKERDEKSHVGAPTTETMHDKGLTTNIGWQNKDSYGNQITGERRAQIDRLRTWQERVRTKDAGERNLKTAFSEIDRMASALGVPDSTREVASVTYRRALEDDLLRGRSIEGIASTALYIACRRQNIARSLDEVTNVSRVEYNEIARAHRYLASELDLEMEPVRPRSYVPRFASGLDLSQEVQEKATEILEVSRENEIVSGKSPPAFAAAAIYGASLLCGEKRTQSEVGDVAEVSDVTIRNRYKEQFEAMGVFSGV